MVYPRVSARSAGTRDPHPQYGLVVTLSGFEPGDYIFTGCQWAVQNRPPMGALKPAGNAADCIPHVLFPAS